MLVAAVCRDPTTRATDTSEININFVLEACQNLLSVDQSGDCRFAHISFQEYLEARHYRNRQAHSVVGKICLQMLCDPDKEDLRNLQRSLSSVPENYDPWDDENILLYAVVSWPRHARQHAKEGIGDGLQLLLKVFLGSPNESSSAFVRWYHLYHAYFMGRLLYRKYCLPPPSAPTFSIVLFGLNDILGDWWISGLDSNLQNDRRESLLYIASAQGNLSAATMLLGRGATLDLQGGSQGTALQVASYIGQEAIVRLLLDHGANIDAQAGHLGNALQAAAYTGEEAIVRMLLERGANVNAQCGTYGNALQAAACGGHQGIIHLLLERGADINAPGGYYGNALQASAHSGKEAVVRLLLDRGADINALGGPLGNAPQASAGNPLNTAWRNSHSDIVILLLKRGADSKALDELTRTQFRESLDLSLKYLEHS